MTRAKTGKVRRRRHKKVLKRAKGFRMTRSRLFKVAHETVLRAGMHAYIGRKLRKRDMRKLWIQRINAAARKNNTKYSQLIHLFRENDIQLNRKMLAEIAVKDPETFTKIVESVTNE
jgi:large subunit ribosomal protein L20